MKDFRSSLESRQVTDVKFEGDSLGRQREVLYMMGFCVARRTAGFWMGCAWLSHGRDASS